MVEIWPLISCILESGIKSYTCLKWKLKTVQIWKVIFKDCFNKIVLNPIFKHERQRIKKSFLHKKCSLACFICACQIPYSLEHYENGFMLRKFCIATRASWKMHGFIELHSYCHLHLVMWIKGIVNWLYLHCIGRGESTSGQAQDPHPC